MVVIFWAPSKSASKLLRLHRIKVFHSCVVGDNAERIIDQLRYEMDHPVKTGIIGFFRVSDSSAESTVFAVLLAAPVAARRGGHAVEAAGIRSLLI
ncbi:hypothetical protein ACFVJ5_00435 [Nocardia sp. NPDC127606]|uniref:hypothetical protein n=1 Tax=Nocardia sp. NPDC127606 TaxID=3345406 RepID=UPI0036406549